ncbi:predicted protein [Postia placenta Mad-698-R]|nr:predicted protein [Postia placenta Mad-698-R]
MPTGSTALPFAAVRVALLPAKPIRAMACLLLPPPPAKPPLNGQHNPQKPTADPAETVATPPSVPRPISAQTTSTAGHSNGPCLVRLPMALVPTHARTRPMAYTASVAMLTVSAPAQTRAGGPERWLGLAAGKTARARRGARGSRPGWTAGRAALSLPCKPASIMYGHAATRRVDTPSDACAASVCGASSSLSPALRRHAHTSRAILYGDPKGRRTAAVANVIE